MSGEVVRLALAFVLVMGVTSISLLVKASGEAAGGPKPNMDSLIAPPQFVKYKDQDHALFDFGGLQILHKVTKGKTKYPQCDVVQKKDRELMVVGQNPRGFMFFVLGQPVAFRTSHNLQWEEILKQTFKP